MMIPYGHQWIDEEDISAIDDVLKSELITQGPKIKELEDALCLRTGAVYAVVVANGTAALHCACLALGIRSGEEVITSPITFVATANCALYCEANVVFADVEKDTGNISIEDVKKKITTKTKLLIPVHYSGHPCDMEGLREIAQKKKICVLEDAAHAVGAKYRMASVSGDKYQWHRVGCCAHSDMAILSFHPVKHITTGEGGAILTNNKTLYEKLLLYRNHGISRKDFVNEPHGEWYYEMQTLGFNYRMTDIQAALGLSQLKKLDMFVEKRRKIVARYEHVFGGNPYFDLPLEKEYGFSSYHLYPIRIKDAYVDKRSFIFSKLREMGIGVQVHYIPVYWQPYYQKIGYKKGLCPAAEDYYLREMSIPIYPSMTDGQIERVTQSVITVFEQI